ncbi:MAG: hypothetical protein V2I43_27910 [Parvularcula sp.]|nr:hypothetical protein [Parvularcula sp.]
MPVLFAAVFAGWVIPQLWSVMLRQVAPGDSLNALLFMSLLCLGAIILGWRMGTRRTATPHTGFLPRVREREAGKAATILTGFALIGFLGLGSDPVGASGGLMWTGRATIFSLVLSIKTASFALALIYFLRRKTGLSTALLVINLIMFAPYIIFYFRRQVILEAALVAAYALLIVRNYAIPRAVVVAGFVVASIGIFAAEEIRGISVEGQAPSLSEIAEIDFLALNPINDPQESPEIKNASHLIYAVQVSGGYTMGGQVWNRFVFQYVPAQFVGADIKQDLMLTPWPAELTYNVNRYVPTTGSTQTGIATAFMEFWYFGSLLFYLNAYVMGRLWRRALAGNSWDKLWYATGIVPSLHMVTHHSAIFYVSFFFFVVSLTFVSFFLRIQKPAKNLGSLGSVGSPPPRARRQY